MHFLNAFPQQDFSLALLLLTYDFNSTLEPCTCAPDLPLIPDFFAVITPFLHSHQSFLFYRHWVSLLHLVDTHPYLRLRRDPTAVHTSLTAAPSL